MIYATMGHLGTRPGCRDDLALMLTRRGPWLADMGCLLYEVGIDDDHPDRVFVIELWTSAEAHRSSLLQPEFQTALAEARPLLSDDRRSQGLTIVGSPLRDAPAGELPGTAGSVESADSANPSDPSDSSDPATPSGRPAVRQLRLVVRAEDYDDAVTFYRDVLGLPERESFAGDGGAHVTILDAGTATLELSNPAQVTMIDGVEAEGSPSDRLRVAIEVEDAAAVTTRLVEAGAELVAGPRETPWRSVNSRLRAPAGLQLTLFQELD